MTRPLRIATLLGLHACRSRLVAPASPPAPFRAAGPRAMGLQAAGFRAGGLRATRLVATLLLAGGLLLAAPRQGTAAEPPPADAGASAPRAEGSGESSPATAFAGGTLFPVSGPMLRRGTLVVRGAKIEAIGEELDPPEGARVVDLNGKYVLPGLVVVEATGVGVGSYGGSFADSLDPYDLGLRVALASGITTVNLVNIASRGSFGGAEPALAGVDSAVVKLTHGDLDSMLIREPGLNYLSLPTRGVEVSIYKLREGLEKAEEHLRAVRDAEAKKQKAPGVPREIAPHVTILQNERPTVVHATTAPQVRDALAIGDRFSFDMIITSPGEALPLAPQIAARRIPVLLKARGSDFDFDLRTPVLDREGLVPVRVPAAFAAAGAEVTLLPYRRGVDLGGLAGRDLTAYLLEAAFAVRGGMEPREALESVTIRPARLLRVDDRVGSLEPGKDADFIVLDHHPLDHRALVEKVYIDGKLYFDRETSPLFRRLEGWKGQGAAAATPPEAEPDRREDSGQ